MTTPATAIIPTRAKRNVATVYVKHTSFSPSTTFPHIQHAPHSTPYAPCSLRHAPCSLRSLKIVLDFFAKILYNIPANPIKSHTPFSDETQPLSQWETSFYYNDGAIRMNQNKYP